MLSTPLNIYLDRNVLKNVLPRTLFDGDGICKFSFRNRGSLISSGFLDNIVMRTERCILFIIIHIQTSNALYELFSEIFLILWNLFVCAVNMTSHLIYMFQKPKPRSHYNFPESNMQNVQQFRLRVADVNALTKDKTAQIYPASVG